MRWHGVLAGAYLTEKAMAQMVTHLCNENLEPLCKRVDSGRICDLEDNKTRKCPRCLKLASKET